MFWVPLKHEKKLGKVYVHPVPPVLDATRPMVLKFNSILRKEVEKRTNGELLWLDFEHDLIEMTGQGKLSLKKSFILDGTHMSPNYLPLLESALEKWDSCGK